MMVNGNQLKLKSQTIYGIGCRREAVREDGIVDLSNIMERSGRTRPNNNALDSKQNPL